MSDPRITLALTTRNRRGDLLRTLDRWADLEPRPVVAVVDNASRDGTAQAVRERHPWVRVIDPGRDLGACARNLVARHTDTPYLAFQDDDTWWEPGALAAAADLLDAHPQVAAVAARVLTDDPGAGPEAVEPTGTAPREARVPAPPGLPSPALGSFLAGAAVLRLDAFRAAGGFSPRLRLGGEDELLAADLAAQGWWLLYAPELTAHRRRPPGSGGRLRRYHGIRNTLWFTWLRRPLPTAARRTVRLAVTVPRDGTSLRAFAAAAAGLPWVVRERRVLPAGAERRLRLLEAADRVPVAGHRLG